jgi:hypothetical protein
MKQYFAELHLQRTSNVCLMEGNVAVKTQDCQSSCSNFMLNRKKKKIYPLGVEAASQALNILKQIQQY